MLKCFKWWIWVFFIDRAKLITVCDLFTSTISLAEVLCVYSTLFYPSRILPNRLAAAVMFTAKVKWVLLLLIKVLYFPKTLRSIQIYKWYFNFSTVYARLGAVLKDAIIGYYHYRSQNNVNICVKYFKIKVE